MANAPALALERRPHRVRIHPPDGGPPIEGIVLLLWHEAEKAPGVPHDRPDVWRCLLQNATPVGSQEWMCSVLGLREVEVVGLRSEFEPIPPLDLMPGRVYNDEHRRYFAEAWALASRFQLQVTFDYAKTGGALEARRGIPTGVRGPLVFTLDTDRGGALRSFKRDGVDSLTICAGQPLPRWVDGHGYQLAAVGS